jgi:hypothetical protein
MIFIREEGKPWVELEKIHRRYSVPLIKIPSKKERPDLYYRVDAHWDASGHAFVAQSIARKLFANDILNLQATRNE